MTELVTKYPDSGNVTFDIVLDHLDEREFSLGRNSHIILDESIYIGDSFLKKGSFLKVISRSDFQKGWYYNPKTNKIYEVPKGLMHKDWIRQPGVAQKIGVDPKIIEIWKAATKGFIVNKDDPDYADWKFFLSTGDYVDSDFILDVYKATSVKQFKNLFHKRFGVSHSKAVDLYDTLNLVHIRLYDYGLLTFTENNKKAIDLFIDTLFDDNIDSIKGVYVQGVLKNMTPSEFLLMDNKEKFMVTSTLETRGENKMQYINATRVYSLNEVFGKKRDNRSYFEKTMPIIMRELKKSGLTDSEILDILDRLKTNL